MIVKHVTESGELYVYMNGSLLYKKWPNGASVLFEKYGPVTYKSDGDRGSYR